MRNKYIASLLMASSCLLATAQELSTEVIVDRSIDTALPAATMPPGIVPESPWNDAAPELPRRSEYSLWAEFTPITGKSGGTDFTGLAAPDTLPGYISLGYFPAYNLRLQAGYSHAFSARTRLSCALMFEGLNYNSHADKSRETVRDNTFGVVLRGTHRHRSNAVTSFHLNYLHAALKNPSYIGVSQSQAITNLMAGVSTERQSNTLYYKAAVTFRHTGLDKDIIVPNINATGTRELKPTSENILRFDGRLAYTIGHTCSMSLNADATMLDNEGYLLDSEQFAQRQKKTRAIIGIRPNFDIRYHGIDIRLGLRIDWSLNTPSSSLHIAPDANVRWRIMPKLSLYGNVNGGQRFYSLYDHMQVSVFAPGYQVFTPIFSPITTRVGLRAGSFGKFSADIHASYSSTDDIPMPVLSSRAGTSFMPVDLSGWSAGIKLQYTSDFAEASIAAEAYQHSYNKGSAACPDRAKYVLDSKLTIHPHAKFEATLNHELRTGRHYYFLSPVSAASSRSMGNVSDLCLMLNYRCNNVLSVFCRIDNMLCRRPYILPHLTSAGMRGLIGATLQF